MRSIRIFCPDDYVRIAIALGRDLAFRARMRAAIAARKHLLYRDPAVLPALEAFLLDTVADARTGGGRAPGAGTDS